ncbi:MAG TPA: SpoIID/LytB domain-containing protein [Candidatus Krumholzibacterium sp.]|nr:SpoIID/LytB domain-containing protein [Candidatus Krumholzibacterium sp.]
MRLRVFSVVITLSGLLISCGRPSPVYRTPPVEILPEITEAAPESDGQTVRVLLLETSGSVDFETDRAIVTEMEEPGIDGRALLSSGSHRLSLQGGTVRVVQGRKSVASAPFIRISPVEGSSFTIDGRSFRGELLCFAKGGKILAVNLIDIEDYLKGVLPYEIGYLKQDEYEAYKVQAVASRSYALSKLEAMKDSPYDLKATVMDQVYKGIGGEDPRASRAVEETRGLVGTWDGTIITAYYSSCCGGHTADIRDGWPWKAYYPYLYGSRDAAVEGGKSFCRESRHFRWEADWTGNALQGILRKTLPAELGARVSPFTRLIDIRTEGVSASGRVKALVFVTDRGEYRVEGDRLRWVLRPESATGPILRSTLFKIEVERSGGRVRSVRVRGGGNGHGTGMCQSGAIMMAREGYSAEQILLHYYPGITLERIDRGSGPR